MELHAKELGLLVLAALLVGFVASVATHFRYEILIWEIGIVVSVALLLLAKFVLSGFKGLAYVLLFVLLSFLGGAASTLLYTRLPGA